MNVHHGLKGPTVPRYKPNISKCPYGGTFGLIGYLRQRRRAELRDKQDLTASILFIVLLTISSRF